MLQWKWYCSTTIHIVVNVSECNCRYYNQKTNLISMIIFFSVTVAFHSTMSNVSTLEFETALAFTDIQVNIGNGYKLSLT